jgi:hypothetical protein
MINLKHLKLFESIGDIKWIVINIPFGDPSEYMISIFDDMESAENYFIELVNDIAMSDKYENEDYEDYNDIIFTVEDAEEYVSSNDYVVEYKSFNVRGKYELPEKLKIGADSKKYNL